MLVRHGFFVEMEMCMMCRNDVLWVNVRRFQNAWVGPCCWDPKMP